MICIIGGHKFRAIDRRNAVSGRTALLEIVKRNRLRGRLIEAEGLSKYVVIKRALAGADRRHSQQDQEQYRFHLLACPLAIMFGLELTIHQGPDRLAR